MPDVTSSELTRDCDAVQIPQGSTVSLPKGTPVHVTQTLGGTFTVHAHGGLFRIAGKDADALGIKLPEQGEAAPATPQTLEVTELQIWETLRTCYDPEIPVNIVDLGLVYDMHLEKLA